MDQQFEDFVERNPHVVEIFVRLSLRAARSGHRVGAKAVWERMRWELVVETDEASPRLNNNYTSRMARLAMARHPELDGFFDIRELRS